MDEKLLRQIISEEIRKALQEEIKQRDIVYPVFIPQNVPVPKFTEYKVNIPVIEEKYYVLKNPMEGQG